MRLSRTTQARGGKRWALAALLALGCGVGLIRAEGEPPSEPAGDGSTEGKPRVLFTGDALFRYEWVRDAPSPAIRDFERARLRVRPGIEVRLGSGLVTLGAGLLGSLASDSNEDNEIRRDNFVSDEVTGDRAYARFAAPRSAFSATVGVAPSPFAGTEVLWDRDLRFHGAFAGGELPPGGHLVAQRLYGGLSLGSQREEDESLTAAVRWEGEASGGISLGAAFWHFDRTAELIEAGLARTNRLTAAGDEYLSDFEIVNVTFGWEHLGERRPLRVRLDLLFNLGADDRRTGGDLRLDWGELQAPGTWRVRLTLQRIEQDAALAAFGGDEWWFRTAQRGARVGFAVAVHRLAIIEVSALRQRRDTLDEWLDRVFADLVLRF